MIVNRISLMIEPTNRCNLKCPGCFSHLDGRKKRDMSFQEFMRIIDGNIDYIRNVSMFNFGEPLLNKDIYKMIKYAKHRGIKHVKLATNGMQLNEENITSLLDSKLDYLSVSLDGATPENYEKFRIGGDFNLVVGNIKNLVNRRDEIESQMKIEVQFIIMKHNENEIKMIENLSKEIGADYLRLKRVYIKKNGYDYLLPERKAYNRYSNAPKMNSCKKPLEEIVINSDGSVIPCCFIVGDDMNNFSLGNAFEMKLKTILFGRKYKNFIKLCLENKSLLSCCEACQEGNINLDYKVIEFGRG